MNDTFMMPIMVVISAVVILCLEKCQAQALTVIIGKPTIISAPDIISKPAKISDYYHKVGKCWVWKPSYIYSKKRKKKCRE